MVSYRKREGFMGTLELVAILLLLLTVVAVLFLFLR